MKLENLDVMFKGDIVKKGETYLLVTETRIINFSGIDLSDGVEKCYLYGDIEVIAIGERGFKEQNKRYREVLEFYANPKTYYPQDGDYCSRITMDYGGKAREALEGEE